MLHSPFPDHVRFAAVHDETLGQEQPHPEELAALGAGAAPSRQRAFALGRVAARKALEGLLHNPPPVLPGDDRAPCWPEGIVGSITHAAEWGLAAADRRSRTRALGLDLAYLPELHGMEIAPLVADAEELRWIDGDPRRLLALFSAKESIYKALYPACRSFFAFHDVTTRWSEAPTPGFHVQLLRPLSPLWPTGAGLRAAVCWCGEFVLTSVWLPV
jgi:enterobactin synthetase component D